MATAAREVAVSLLTPAMSIWSSPQTWRKIPFTCALDQTLHIHESEWRSVVQRQHPRR